jgi:hypothetical protein
VSENETKGRFLVAVREIKFNEVILKEEPLVIGPKFISPNPVCLGCLKSIAVVASSPKCSNCNWPVCDLKCKGIVSSHKLECNFLAADERKEKKNYKLVAIDEYCRDNDDRSRFQIARSVPDTS